MVALPKTHHAHPLLPRLRRAGAEVVQRDGLISIRNASRVPPALIAEAKARRGDLLLELNDNDPQIVVPCERCGIDSRPFIAIANPDLWMCDTCLPDERK